VQIRCQEGVKLDTKVIQDIKLAQQLIKAATDGGHGINLTIINGLHVGNDIDTTRLGPVDDGDIMNDTVANGTIPNRLNAPLMPRVTVHQVVSVLDDALLELFREGLKITPKPRLATAMKAIFQIARDVNTSVTGVGNWLGIGYESARHNLRRFKIENPTP